MKIIELADNKKAMVDDDDYGVVSRWEWQIKSNSTTHYAVRKAGSKRNRRNVWMHRLILGLSYGYKRIVDHKNGNGLDNRKSNLRIATVQQNNANSRKHKDAVMSKYKGVYWEAERKKWRAYIYFTNQDGIKKKIWLGRFNKEYEAATAYNNKAVELFGEFVKPNIVMG